MTKIEKIIIALGVISFFLFVYYVFKNEYSSFGLFLVALPVFWIITLFILALRYRLKYKDEMKVEAIKIIEGANERAKQIIDKANDEVSKKKEELARKQKELIDREKQAEAKIEQYKKQMQANNNAMHAKNVLLNKIKQIAFADRDPKSKIEEIKRRLYEL